MSMHLKIGHDGRLDGPVTKGRRPLALLPIHSVHVEAREIGDLDVELHEVILFHVSPPAAALEGPVVAEPTLLKRQLLEHSFKENRWVER